MGEDDAPSEEVGALTEDAIRSMRQAGLNKPEGVSWSQWKSTKKFTARHSLVSYLAAIGLKNVDIAKETGLSAGYISQLLNDPKVRLEVSYLQRQMFGEDPRRRFQSLFSDSVDIVEEVMKNQNEKGATRLTAAQMVQERVLGRPTQQVELGGNLIRALFEKLDQKDKDRKILDVTPNIERPMLLIESHTDDNDQKIDIDSPNEVEVKPSEIDSWIENNLGVKPK